MDVKAGDKVLFGKYSGSDVTVDGEELLVMREDEILAVRRVKPSYSNPAPVSRLTFYAHGSGEGWEQGRFGSVGIGPHPSLDRPAAPVEPFVARSLCWDVAGRTVSVADGDDEKVRAHFLGPELILGRTSRQDNSSRRTGPKSTTGMSRRAPASYRSHQLTPRAETARVWFGRVESATSRSWSCLEESWRRPQAAGRAECFGT